VPIALHHEFEDAGEHRRGGGLVQLAVDDGRHRRLQVLVPQQLGQGGDRCGGVAGQPLGPARGRQEPTEPRGNVDGRQLLLDHGPGQEVLLHEGPEAGADLVLLARDDRGVRDR
jgi:hypothetical protein